MPFGLALFFANIAKASKMINIIADQLPRDPERSYLDRNISQIEFLVIHHSATTGGSPQAFAEYHVNNNGWPGIGYHYVIQPDGKIYQTQPLTKSSYHTGSGDNYRSVGICLSGDFSNKQPAPAQMNALIWLLRYLKSILPPVAIVGHKDLKSSTSCPGSINVDQINEIVNQQA